MTAGLGTAIAGFATRLLSVEDIVPRDKKVCVLVNSSGKTGVREFGVCIRGQHVSCSCSDCRKRGVHCKHIALVTLYEMAEAAQALSEYKEIRGQLLQCVGLRPLIDELMMQFGIIGKIYLV